MGVVYRATQLALDRPVALKVIATHLAGDEAFRERFLRESRLAASLGDHPNVVPVYDAREEDGELIVVMRLVAGGDLKRRIAAEGPLPPAEAIELLGQIAAALDAAHAAGIVHRDVKPHNILLEGRDRAFLTDFGLAKALGDSGVLSGISVAGTVEYMSPEQWRGASVGPAADVYSLGCVLYEALTGIVPYARQAADTEPEMPEGLDRVIERAVDKDPERRYPSAGALIAAARELQSGEPAATQVLSDTPGRPTAVIEEPLRRRSGREWLAHKSRRALLSVGVILAVIALGAAAQLLFGGNGVSVSDPVPIGKGPLRVATGARSVWVTSAADGTLSRVDLDTNAVSGRPLPLEPGLAGVAVGAASVWVSSPRSGDVLRVDGDSGRIERRIHVGGRPGAIVFGGDRVWVADEDGGGVTAINADGARVFRRHIAPHQAPLRLAVGAGAVWVSNAASGSIRRIDLGSGIAGRPIVVGRGPSGITVGGGLVWVANSRGNSVTRIDPVTRTILGEPVPVGDHPGGIDAGTKYVWVANARERSVNRISIESGDVVGGPIAVGVRPGAVTVAGEAVWVANNGDGSVTRIEP